MLSVLTVPEDSDGLRLDRFLVSLLLAPLAIVMLLYLSRTFVPEPKRARKAA